MINRKWRAYSLGLTCMVAGMVSGASADIIAVQGLPSSFEANTGSFTLGFEFSPKVNITVTELGSYFPSLVNNTSTHGMALWDAVGNELAAATLELIGNGGPAGFYFTPITPVTLTAGEDYYVGGTTVGDNFLGSVSGSPTVASQIDYIIHAEIGTVGVNPIFPTVQFANFNDFGGNFEFTTSSSIPEPSTWAMMALGFAGLAFAGWRSQRRSVAIAT
jgi:hypothetical protein